MLPIAKLKPSQDSFRHEHHVELMIVFVSNGGFFTQEYLETYGEAAERKFKPKLIAINRFEDGELLIRDGHHRVGAILLAGREYLHPAEYVIEDREYREFLEINFAAGWLTPFDPRTELRKGNVYTYWTEVRRLLDTEGEQAAARYIRANKSMYAVPRTPAHNAIHGLIQNGVAAPS